MRDSIDPSINNMRESIYINFNFEDIIIKLQHVVDDLKNKIDNNCIINQVNDIISIMKQYEENKNRNESVVNVLKDFNKIEKIYENGKYTGEIKNNLREGKGTFLWTSGQFKGDTYEGDWKDDKREGKGKYFVNNGNRYEGDFKNKTNI